MARDVTVLLTCYNERAFIAAAIESVSRQSAFDRVDRILVVDDGSTDGSHELLLGLVGETPRLEIKRITNVGLAAARNVGLREINTPLVALLDGDDLWSPKKLERQLDAQKSTPEKVALLYGDVVEFSQTPEDGHQVRMHAYSGSEADTLGAYFLNDGPIIPSTILMRMDAARSIDYFDARIKLFEDTDFYLRIAEAGFSFRHVAGSVTYKRKRPGSLSSQIGKWEAAMLGSTQEWGKRQPQLAPLMRKRDGRRLAKIADACFQIGMRREGWDALSRSIARDPANARTYIYGMLAMTPASLRGRLKRMWALARVQSASVRPDTA